MSDDVRVRLDLGYDGTDFSGWARQPGLRTVQETLTTALTTVLRVPTAVTVAGRTDAGVHARGQVVHLDLPAPVWQAVPGRSDRAPGEALVTRLAGVLPPDVVVGSARVVPDAFDARFGALWRRYAYRICDRTADPLTRAWVLRHRRPLDEVAMDAAARDLVGEHDFLAFCKPREGATTIRTLQRARVRRQEDGVVVVDVQADAFCHSMVRSLVGALLAVGEGRRPPSWPRAMLDARRRDGAVAVAPPGGLVLEEVAYPGDDALAAQSARARTVRTLPSDDQGDDESS